VKARCTSGRTRRPALKVDFAGGYVYKEPELVVVDEEIRSLER
jgi:hypothetical protein